MSAGLWAVCQRGSQSTGKRPRACAIPGQALRPLLPGFSVPLLTQIQPPGFSFFCSFFTLLTFLSPHLEVGSKLLCPQNCPILFSTGYDGLLVNTVTFLSRNCHSHAHQKTLGDVSGSPAGPLCFYCRGARGWPLVWELRSHKPHGMALPKNLPEKTAKKTAIIWELKSHY